MTNASYTEIFEVGRCYNLQGDVHLKYELEGDCSKMREIRYTSENCTGLIGHEDTIPHMCYNFTLQDFRSFSKHCTRQNYVQNGSSSLMSPAKKTVERFVEKTTEQSANAHVFPFS